MTTIRRVGIVGGGPAGLYAARLLKLGRPSLEVTVYERNDPSETFGFGVALTGNTQRNLAAADAGSWAAIQAAGFELGEQQLRVPAGAAVIRGGSSLGIGRAPLLRALLACADRAAVRLEIGHWDASGIDADVILACDGVNSATRAELAGELGVRVEVGRELYLWCGTDFALPRNVFIPVTTEHGTFVAHAYPYAPESSTVLIETNEATWRAAGFDRTTAALEGDGTGASDDASLSYLEEAFAPYLDGHPLLGNRTRWLRFNTVSCSRWHHGRTVLLGDAAHTAHYSLGSGTKLAMEDAIALSRCLIEGDDAGACFSTYEAIRRPAVTRIQDLARRSQRWWESFPRRMGLSPAQAAVAYMTRAGNVSLEQLTETNCDLVASALASYSGVASSSEATDDPAARVLEQPFVWKGRRFPTRVLTQPFPPGYREVAPGTPEAFRAAPAAPGEVVVAVLSVEVADPWGPEGDAVVETVRGLLGAGADGVRLTGGGDRHAVLDHLALGERLRTETGALVVVEGADDLRADLAAGLISGRCDLVAPTPVPVDLRAAATDGRRPEAAVAPAPRYRIGLVVPSSNVTVETEMPALLSRHADARFSFHASRMQMRQVSAAELAAMNAQAARCVDELGDAGVDALLYGCLVAVIAQGPGEHRRVEAAITTQLRQRALPTHVASSAGALVEALGDMGATTIALVTPYMRPLAEKVVTYLEDEGVKVADWRALEVADNAAVGCIPGEQVMSAARSLDLGAADALVISACVQMPSLDLVQPAEDTFGLPVLSAATAAAYVLLRRLGLPPVLPGAGSLLAGGLSTVPRLALAQEAR